VAVWHEAWQVARQRVRTCFLGRSLWQAGTASLDHVCACISLTYDGELYAMVLLSLHEAVLSPSSRPLTYTANLSQGDRAGRKARSSQRSRRLRSTVPHLDILKA